MLLVLILVLLLALVVLWVVLPFAVFGLKARIDVLIEETRKTNKLLQAGRGGSDPQAINSSIEDPWAPPGTDQDNSKQ